MYVKVFLADRLTIKLAPTGMIPPRDETPHVPLTPKEPARGTFRAYRLGASVVHVHARDDGGKPAHKREYFENIFSEIRPQCPDTLFSATTSGGVTPQVEHRTEVLDVNPEIARLTLGSLNFPQYPSVNSLETKKTIASLMKRKEILPTLEIFEGG